jgi:hypothetical protein
MRRLSEQTVGFGRFCLVARFWLEMLEEGRPERRLVGEDVDKHGGENPREFLELFREADSPSYRTGFEDFRLTLMLCGNRTSPVHFVIMMNQPQLWFLTSESPSGGLGLSSADPHFDDVSLDSCLANTPSPAECDFLDRLPRKLRLPKSLDLVWCLGFVSFSQQWMAWQSVGVNFP